MCRKQSHVPEIHSVYHLLTFIFMSLCLSGLRQDSVSSLTSEGFYSAQKRPAAFTGDGVLTAIFWAVLIKMLQETAEVLTYLTSGWKCIRGEVSFHEYENKPEFDMNQEQMFCNAEITGRNAKWKNTLWYHDIKYNIMHPNLFSASFFSINFSLWGNLFSFHFHVS